MKIDYSYYCEKAQKIIDKIENAGKKTVKKIDPMQISMF
jgi:hypothetical protein